MGAVVTHAIHQWRWFSLQLPSWFVLFFLGNPSVVRTERHTQSACGHQCYTGTAVMMMMTQALQCNKFVLVDGCDMLNWFQDLCQNHVCCCGKTF